MKASKYNIILDLKNGEKLAFNSMSCALAKIDNDFTDIIENIDHINYDELEPEKRTLADNMLLGKYILSDDFDELKALKYGHFSGKFKDDSLNLTIAPTMSCNFACSYCYENSKSGIMNKDVQNAIINWIAEEAKKKKDISILWYGGEPLLAKNVIFDMTEKIIEICKKNNNSYSASMITNGYLLDNTTIAELMALKINSVQITLDGPASIHNSRRVLKNTGESTFDIILDNIKKLKENNFAITIRMNVDKTNTDYIDEFLDVLIQNDLRDTFVSFARVTDKTGTCISVAEACMNTEQYAKENLKLQRKLLANGFNTSIPNEFSEFYPYTKNNYCGADNVGTFVLDTEGYMYKCWYDIGETHKAIGNVLDRHGEPDEGMNMQNIDYVLWSPFDHEECLKCNLLPICMGGCPYSGFKNGSKPECSNWKYNLEEVLKSTYLQSNAEDSEILNSATENSNLNGQNENIYSKSIYQDNQKPTEKRISQEYSHKIGLKMVGWEITQRCNLTCPHCYTAAAAANQSVPELSTDQCYKLIEDFARLGTEIIGWTGGEPLLRKDLEDLISFAGSLGIRSGLTTNGLLFDEKRAASLKQAGLEFVQVSLDGSTPARNAKIRNCKESDFELVLNAIRNSSKMGMRTNMAMLLCAETVDDALPYMDLAQQLGIEIVRFCGFVPTGRGKKSEIAKRYLFSGDHLARLREFVEITLKKENANVLFDPAFGSLPPDHSFHNCIAGMGQLYLDTLGNVYPCTSMIDPLFLVGNIHDRSIEDIYKDERMRPTSGFSETCLKGRCSSCKHLLNCHGGCRGIALAHTGDIHSSFPYCLK